MKKVVFVLIALMAFNTQAQKEHHARKKSNLTPEQMAIMRTKQLTLALDLNESQQTKILALNNKNAAEFSKMKAERGERKELTDDEKFELKNKMLDKQIAIQKEMKTILDESQFEQWKKMQKSRMNSMRKKHGEHQKRKAHAKEKEKK